MTIKQLHESIIDKINEYNESNDIKVYSLAIDRNNFYTKDINATYMVRTLYQSDNR